MVGQRFILIVAALAVAQASFTPPTRNQILTVNGKVADPSQLRWPGAGAADLPRINGLDSAVVYVPSKDGSMGATFAAGTTQLSLTARYLTATTYELVLALPGLDCGIGGANIDTSFAVAAQVGAPAVSPDGSTTTLTFTIPTSNGAATTDWNDRRLDREKFSRKICIRDAANTFTKWTGATLRTAFDCTATAGGCSTFSLTGSSEFETNDLFAIASTVRTVCCQASTSSVVPAVWRIGVCINPNVQTCCGGSVAGPSLELTTVAGAVGPVVAVFNKCCKDLTELLVDDVNQCPCRSANAQPTPAGGIRGVNTDCSGANDRCCLPDPARYPELSRTLGATTEQVVVDEVWGLCYDSTVSFFKCCATGQLYNEGTQRCCIIGGVQPIDVPCACSTDAQCDSNRRCCTASNPDRPIPREAERCNIYQSYPYNPNSVLGRNFGGNPLTRTDFQLCYGTCINPNFQSCCNGVVCQRAYEKCCNSTCCNKFSETCIEGLRSSTSPSNPNSFRTTFYTCSSIELLTVLKSGMIYIIPLALLLATLGGLGIVLVFANKASNRSYSFIESAMIVFALISILVSLPLYFSPMFKYGVFIVLASLISILSAAARVKVVNLFAVAAQIVILFYIFDPIHGNRYLTFTSFPNLVGNNAGIPDTESKGLLHTTTSMFYRNGVVNTTFCTTFYDFFRLDGNARDTTRFDNPDINTFGYCKRGWVAFLLIFEGILIVAFVLLFVVSLISLLLRFRKAVILAPITLEILKEDLPFTPVPLY